MKFLHMISYILFARSSAATAARDPLRGGDAAENEKKSTGIHTDKENISNNTRTLRGQRKLVWSDGLGCPQAYTMKKYFAGELAAYNSHVYQCASSPTNLFCGMLGYRPEIDLYWNVAWTLIGTCSGVLTPATTMNSGSSARFGGCPGVWQHGIHTLYKEGDRVSKEGKLFQCKAYPYAGHCSQQGYEPLTNPATPGAWMDAWEMIGYCEGDLKPTTPEIPKPTLAPTKITRPPSKNPTSYPTRSPTRLPSISPTTSKPSLLHSDSPSTKPLIAPSQQPSVEPSVAPSGIPSTKPSLSPSQSPSTKPSLTPSRKPSEKPSDIPSTSPSLSPTTTCPGHRITIAVEYDVKPEETVWFLDRKVGNSWDAVKEHYASEGDTSYSESICLETGDYEFAIYDQGSARDGICCGHGEGSYNVMIDGALLVQGGDFGWREETLFTLPFLSGNN